MVRAVPLGPGPAREVLGQPADAYRAAAKYSQTASRSPEVI